MSNTPIESIHDSVVRFTEWLDRYGETSWDHQSFFASPLTRSAKALYYKQPLLGTLAVSPMIICEAAAPWARRFFWKRQRFPIADAHYAMGFAYLARTYDSQHYHERAVHFLRVLEASRSKGYSRHCWGYPFNWETRRGTIREGTPLITTVPYVYEAFREVFEIDGDERWLEIMRSIAQHAMEDYDDHETSKDASTCSYSPDPNDRGGVINASAYRAFLLTRASVDCSEEGYLRVGERNLNFVIESQNSDGSWYYAVDGQRDFIDHFHTCFVLKALTKIHDITGNARCKEAIDRGVRYYVENLFEANNVPKPFSRRPRLTVYRSELYDLAECINLAVLLMGRYAALDSILANALKLDGWQKRDGSFRSRQLLLGWDNTPMHRWGQAQMFRSLSFFLHRTADHCETDSGQSACAKAL